MFVQENKISTMMNECDHPIIGGQILVSCIAYGNLPPFITPTFPAENALTEVVAMAIIKRIAAIHLFIFFSIIAVI